MRWIPPANPEDARRVLSSVLERIRDGVIALNLDWQYTYVNPQAAQMLGKRHPSDLIGKHALTEFPDAMERPWGRAYARALATQEASVLEGHNQKLDRWFLSRIYPSPDGLTVYITETTEQKRAERLMAESIAAREQAEGILRNAEEQLQRAVSAGNVGLWDWNLETDEVYFSPEWKRQLGYADDEIDGHVDEWRSRLHPDDEAATVQAVKDYLANPDSVYDRTFRLRHKDGSYRSILARGQLIRDAAGRNLHLLGSHIDITERTQMETRLRLAQRMESVGRLAGGVAHDFNNLLVVINNCAELIVEGVAADTALLERALMIRRAGGRAAQLTQQLLAFSRQQALKPAILNLHNTVKEMAPMLRRLIGEDIVMTVTGDAELSSVSADPGQIDQVIMNLVVNARDAMPDGGQLDISLHNSRLDESHGNERLQVQPGPYVELRVADNGTGMSELTRERIFEPFYTTKEMGRGTGLGLPTVYGVVKQSGGYIFVDSVAGAGTTFHVYLPAVEGVPDAQPPGAVGVPPRGTETILIVEDDNDVRVLTALLLTTAGYHALLASSGEEALEVLRASTQPIDLVLTDVVMPGMGGRRFAEHLFELRPEARLLYMSGYIESQERIIGPKEHFIGKPFTNLALLSKIREMLDG
ncbi:MAG TPA: PAS domain-containing protein [Vicinamibacterales bacterium]|nr:PAS domain-containing protein [Vicinamibacterales bacterium]